MGKDKKMTEYPLQEYAEKWTNKYIEWHEIAPLIIAAMEESKCKPSKLLEEMGEYKEIDDYMREYEIGNLYYCEFEQALIELLEKEGYKKIEDITYQVAMESWDIFNLMEKEEKQKQFTYEAHK